MEAQDSRHGLHQRLVALTDGVDEPACRIEFVADEGGGLTRLLGLGHPFVVSQHVAVVATHVQFGYITRVEYYE